WRASQRPSGSTWRRPCERWCCRSGSSSPSTTAGRRSAWHGPAGCPDVPGSAYEAFELAVRARVPLIALITPEERRAEDRLIRPVAAAWREGRAFVWSITRGYSSLEGEEEDRDMAAPDPPAAREVIER